jgi:hypothetical protein
LRQSSDQNANLLGDLRSSAAWPGSPPPIETEAGAVPADHGFGLHQNKDVRPAGPALPECRPEESIPAVQFGPRPFPFQHGYLLSEGEDFEGVIASTAKEDSDGHEKREDDLEHEFILLTRLTELRRADAAKSQTADFKQLWAIVYRRFQGGRKPYDQVEHYFEHC